MIKEKSYTLEDMDSNELEVILSRFPATIGREIAAKYPMANLPRIGDYKVSEQTMLELMKYVAVRPRDASGKVIEGAALIELKTQALVDNHTRDAETCMKIEMAMLEYNFSFFRKGRISDFLGEFVQMIVGKILEMSNPSSEPSSTAGAQPFTSSGPSTT